MSNIGLIVRADAGLDALPADWTPKPLGSRAEVIAVLESETGVSFGDARNSLGPLRLEMELEEGGMPRSITLSGAWGEGEMGLIRKICARLGARFYDSESAEFLYP